MSIIGLGSVAIATMLADLSGDDRTRWFTRRVFVIVAIYAFGVRASTLAAIGSGAMDVVPL